ncbi:MAG: di-trans,poly-cis-decaprenylcistransferase [Bacteroidales bacterium]|nr:di-trans,poly-cis-decaprenylcistransferase [Bacteroidales bacterium]
MDKNQLPKHVSIIMDGNGRWAKLRGKERVYGHFEGVESVRACMETAVEMGIEYLSVYAFSEENWNRPQDEVISLMELMMKSMVGELENFMDHQVRFMVLGNRARLSEGLNATIDRISSATAHNKGTTFILFLSYSGKWDIMQAMKKAAAALTPEQFQQMKQEDLDQYLITAGIPDPDLMIRTSGELRISNYLLWQTAYSEFYFTETLWPDFRKPQFMEALEAYAARDRRYGKVK